MVVLSLKRRIIDPNPSFNSRDFVFRPVEIKGFFVIVPVVKIFAVRCLIARSIALMRLTRENMAVAIVVAATTVVVVVVSEETKWKPRQCKERTTRVVDVAP